jgi:hypothetical protein
LILKCEISCFQNFAFKCNLYRYAEGYPLEKLTSMRVAFPTKERSSAALAFEHLQWWGLYNKLNPVDPWLERTRLQPLSL